MIQEYKQRVIIVWAPLFARLSVEQKNMQSHCPPLNSSLAQKCTLVHTPGKNTAGLKFRIFAQKKYTLLTTKAKIAL